jgi:hypothetical protein
MVHMSSLLLEANLMVTPKDGRSHDDLVTRVPTNPEPQLAPQVILRDRRKSQSLSGSPDLQSLDKERL